MRYGRRSVFLLQVPVSVRMWHCEAPETVHLLTSFDLRGGKLVFCTVAGPRHMGTSTFRRATRYDEPRRRLFDVLIGGTIEALSRLHEEISD